MWLVVVAVVVMLAMAAAAATVLLWHPAKKGPSYPSSWDPRIAPYAKIAERQRGLLFLHPVYVHFLSPAAFRKTVTTDDKAVSKDDRAKLDEATGLLRAVGLLHGKLDLLAADNTASGGGTLAYYSFDTKSVTIRGQRITPSMRSTIVHELTHALQDQHFDIGARMKALQKSKDPASAAAYSVLDSIVEGDAERVETKYHDSLGRKARKSLDASQKADFKQANQEYKKVPQILVTQMTAPYTLGEALLAVVEQNGGNAAVDRLLRKPPTQETVLLDPFKALDDPARAIKVGTPTLDQGDKKIDASPVGALTWYLILADRLPARDALTAADGWGGDASLDYRHDNTSCTRMSFVGRTAAATARMSNALHRWAAAAPGTAATVADVGRQVRLQSCDPGTKATTGKDQSEAAIELAAVRAYLGRNVEKAAHTNATFARCYAGKLVDQYAVTQLDDPTFGANDPATQQHVRQIAMSCR